MISQVAEFESVEVDVSARVLPPWEANPYRLVSWWEMQDFSAAAVYWSGQILENLKTDCLMKSGPGSAMFESVALHRPLDDETVAKATDFLTKVLGECRRIGLQISADTLQQEVLDRFKPRGEEQLPYLWLMQQLSNLQRLIQREMSSRLFFFVSADKAQFWPTSKQPDAFGEQVHKAFPSAYWDSQQAAFSLSAGFDTASVFHLMRVLEIVLGALGNKFGVSLAYTNWAPAIEQIESKIRDMHKDPAWKALPDCKGQQEFFAQAASHFGILKDAWRNYTMHTRAKYTAPEAEQIFRSVRAFTQKLAERLSE